MYHPSPHPPREALYFAWSGLDEDLETDAPRPHILANSVGEDSPLPLLIFSLFVCKVGMRRPFEKLNSNKFIFVSFLFCFISLCFCRHYFLSAFWCHSFSGFLG